MQNRMQLESNDKNTIELETSNGVIAITVLGGLNAREAQVSALVVAYLTDNPIVPTISCTATEARRFAHHIIRAADAAEALVAELARKGAS